MLHACVERFDVICERGNILGWDGEVNKAHVSSLVAAALARLCSCSATVNKGCNDLGAMGPWRCVMCVKWRRAIRRGTREAASKSNWQGVRISARCAVENLGERRPVGGQIINGQKTHAMTMTIANFFVRMHGHRRTWLRVHTPMSGYILRLIKLSKKSCFVYHYINSYCFFLNI
jgi:hypothetical protein